MAGIMLSTIYGTDNTLTLSITGDTANLNLHDFLIASGWNGTSIVTFVLTVNTGVALYSNSLALPALDIGSPFPSGSTIILINNGTIIGAGGAGGASNGGGAQGLPGGTGGLALVTTVPIIVDNSSGVISGALKDLSSKPAVSPST